MPSRDSLRFDLPLGVWVAIMVTLSSLPGKRIPEVGFRQWDKLAHAVAYLVLAFLLFRFLHWRRHFSWVRARFHTLWIALLYAGLDELHQLFIPNRSCAWQDFVADGIGVGLALFVALEGYRRWLPARSA
jgi:VanZ family protein